MREFTAGAIAAGIIFALIAYVPDMQYGAGTAEAQIGRSTVRDTIDIDYGGKVAKAIHTATDTVVAKSVLSLPEFTTSSRPTCDGSTDVGNASGQPWIIVNTTDGWVEHCNNQDGSWGWDPLGLDGDGDGLKRINSAGATIDEDDTDDNNQPVRGDFSIPDATVGDPGSSDRTVTSDIPDGLYGSGDEVSFDMPGDADLVAGNIKYGEDIFGTTGTLRYEVTETFSGTDAQITVSGDTGYLRQRSAAIGCAAIVVCREKGFLSVDSFMTDTAQVAYLDPTGSGGACSSLSTFASYIGAGGALSLLGPFNGSIVHISGATCTGTEGS